MKMILITLFVLALIFAVIYITFYADTVSKQRKNNNNDHKL